MSLHPTFMGLSVMDWRSSVGWGLEQTSELRVSLVQDVEQGDYPEPPALGQPIYFQFFNFQFFGLLQKFAKKQSPNGLPTWEAICIDPRDILRGAQLVTSQYMGETDVVSNLLSPFGWWENYFGFGASLANDSGMPWNQIVAALASICNVPGGTPYGGPLSFRGVYYGLDLSQLPVPDDSYRIGGGSGGYISLMDAIASICDDGGCDFFVDLIGLTIRVRTVSRLSQPPLGTIGAITNTNWGNVLRTEDGLEVRNEVTSAFLTGGEVCELYQTDYSGIVSFWGYDPLGNPIIGIPGTWTFLGPPGQSGSPGAVLGEVACESMVLNADSVADVVGSTTYACTTLEMRLAMANYESWSAFIWHQRPELRPYVYSPFLNAGGLGLLQARPNIVNDAAAAAMLVGMAGINSDFHLKSQRLYEFVKGYGSEFYGKKFLVGVPFVLVRQDPETLKVGLSQEPTDGGWLPEGSSPLGLALLNEDVFKNGDGRFRAFTGFASIAGLDLSRVSPGDSVVQNGTLYLRASVEQGNVVFLPATGQPAALLSLGSAVYKEAVECTGDSTIVGMCLSMPPAQAQPWLNRSFGPVGLRIHPEAVYPDAAAVPLKSNVLTYGPWYVSGAPGKVRYEADPTMTPWNYGDWGSMDAAGTARVVNAVTNMQVSEAGLLELAGPPTVSLGDVLQGGGPNVTNIEVSYGKDGVTTSYRFATFTPRFGVFSKQLGDRIKRLGLTGQELRKAIRAGANQADAAQETAAVAFTTFLAHAPRAVNPRTPHEAMVVHTLADTDDQGNISVRTCPMSMTYEEAVALVRGDDPAEYATKACVSLDGLFRPFTTAIAGSGSPQMPGFASPSCTQGMTSTVLNPYQTGNDITYLAFGDTYSRLHSYEAGNDPTNTRGVALRGPLVVAGWGYDMDGNPVPGNGTGGWLTNVLRRSDQWRAGPVDMLWDARRGVWSSHDLLAGSLVSGIPAGGSGLLQVDGYTGSGWQLTVWNYFGSSVSASGTKAICGYVAPLNRWYVIAADCATG